jgi:hypothetical protein
MSAEAIWVLAERPSGDHMRSSIHTRPFSLSHAGCSPPTVCCGERACYSC